MMVDADIVSAQYKMVQELAKIEAYMESPTDYVTRIEEFMHSLRSCGINYVRKEGLL